MAKAKPKTKPTAKKKKSPAVDSGFTLASYHAASKDLFSSLILVLPLFVFYQFGVLATGGVRNGVDFITDLMWYAANGSMGTYLLINLGILIAFIIAIFALRHHGTFKPKLYPWVIAESSAYAMLLGSGVVLLMSSLGLDALLSTGGGGDYGIFTSIILSLGAGLYEETVFRLILMGGMFYAGLNWMKLPRWLAAVGAVLISSFIFSAIHYVGPLADTFMLGSFIFRFFAGILLAAIFYLRGFAVAVYTHAIYDIIVMVFN